MTPLKLPIYLLLSILVIACGKDKAKDDDKPDVPCLGSFSCKINGVPFESSGSAGCSSQYFAYSANQKSLIIAGTDCRVDENSFRGVSIKLWEPTRNEEYIITNGSAQYVNNSGIPFAFNHVLDGEIYIIDFVEINYSEDWHGGYVEGTFWFTSYNEELQDTVYVTNGEFCGRL